MTVKNKISIFIIIRLMIETLEELKQLWGFSICYHIFAMFMYKHPCIVYLQEMKLMGMFVWTLMSIITYLESLIVQISAIIALQTIVTPGMYKYPVIFNLLVRYDLVGSLQGHLLCWFCPICVII